MKYLIYLIFISNILFSGEMQKIYLLEDDTSRHYLIYVPDTYDKTIKTNIVFGFHGYGGTASGFESEVSGGFNKLADKYNFIAVYPESTYFYDKENTLVTTFNDIIRETSDNEISNNCLADDKRIIYPKFPNCDRGRCGWAPCVDDTQFIKKLIDNLKIEFNVKDVYLIGNSTGGMFVNSYVCKYPKSVKAAISINGLPRYGFSCVPDEPVNFISYASLKDKTIPPIGKISYDGLFYETQSEFIENWRNTFNCKNQKKSLFKHYEEFEEKTFFECDENIKIMSILNLNSDHMWPEAGYNQESKTSSYTNFGTCVSDIQNDLNTAKCYRSNDRWGSEYILRKLFTLNDLN